MIVGIDPGSQLISFAVFNEATYQLLSYDSVSTKIPTDQKKRRPRELVDLFMEAAERAVGDLELPVWYIEEPFGANVSGIAAVERTVGVLLDHLYPHAELLAVPSWKRNVQVPSVPREHSKRNWEARRDAALAQINGTIEPRITTKTQIKSRCIELFPTLPDSLEPIDIYDAILIGLAGVRINNGDYKE